MTRRKNVAAPSVGRAQLMKPQGPIYSGRGDYLSDIRSLASETRVALKAAQTAVKAAKALKNIPNKKQLAKKVIKGFLGSGDYTGEPLHYNSLINPTTATTGAMFSHQGRRGTRIMESEYIGDIRSGAISGGSSLFNNQVYRLNPSNATLFPWLSQFADLYDQWEPQGIIFEYRTTSSTFNGTSQALGVVVGAVDYDPSDAPYATKQEMENADYAISTVASSNFMVGVECDPAERPNRVMYTGDPPPGSSIVGRNFYDLGSFQVATQGMSDSDVTIGELWVHYDIVFYKKQVPPVPLAIPQFVNLASNHVISTGTRSLASGLSVVASGTLIEYEPTGGDITVLIPGNYLVHLYMAFTEALAPTNFNPLQIPAPANSVTYIANPTFTVNHGAGSETSLTLSAEIVVTLTGTLLRMSSFNFTSFPSLRRCLTLQRIDFANEPFNTF